MMTPETRNLIVAIALSLAILIGWQALVVRPQIEGDKPSSPTAAISQVGSADSSLPNKTISQTAQIKDIGRRVTIDSPAVIGSISTMGARIDDIILSQYSQTLEPESEPIRLLRRFDGEQPYFFEFGWSGNPSEAMQLPDSKTIWNSNTNKLTPQNPLILSYDNGKGLSFERTIAINEDYLLTIRDSVTSYLDKPISLSPYALIRRNGTPTTAGLYILHEGPLGVFDKTLDEQNYDDLQKAGEAGIRIPTEQAGGWIGITDKYWLAALMPDQDKNVTFSMRAIGADRETYQTDLLGAAMQLSPGETISWQNYAFAGAKRLALLDKYTDELNIPHFDLAIDFGWFYFLTKPFFYAISALNHILGNFGLAIICFTIIVRLFLFPLANKSFKSMAKMRDLAPKIQKMREDFGDDRARLNQEMMAIYKTEKVNPAAGCLPILLQIPVFFALYKVLYVSIEMRHAPFFGWVRDLSAVDPTSIFNLFGLLPYSVSALPSFLSVGVWPILMGISMALQMRLNPPPPDPIQAKIFQWMPVFFTFLLAGFPAGLVIYWTWNNLLSIAQQWWITKNVKRTT